MRNVIYLSEPEIVSNKNPELFKIGDKLKLDPGEIDGSQSFENRVDLNEVFTVLSIASQNKGKNAYPYQLLILDKKVVRDEDETGWSNSWFILA